MSRGGSDSAVEDNRLTEQLIQMHFDHLKELYRLSDAVIAQGEDGVLLCLYRVNRSMLPGEIMSRMGLTTGRVANILRRLEEKGLVLRLQDADDRRRVHVSLTDAGVEAAKALHRDFTRRQASLLDYLGDEDAREALRLLGRCLSYYRAGAER